MKSLLLQLKENFRKVLVEADNNLLSETYYHGIVNCADVEKLLIKDGDFLFGIPEEDEEQVLI